MSPQHPVNVRGGGRHTAFRPWVAVVGGAVVGIALATTVTLLWPSFVGTLPTPRGGVAGPETAVALFRLSEPPHELVVVRAGPDATGEPTLSAGLFPDTTPVREIASVMLVNRAERDAWDVDLAGLPLRGRAGDGAPWEDLEPLAPADARRLGAPLAVRFRALVGAGPTVRVEPGSVRRLLVALPQGRTIDDLSDVQWDGRPLERRSLDIESLHALREHGDEQVRPTRRR